jgi:serine/threonine protein kinase
VLTNVLGARPDTEVHLLERQLSGGETLLLCSDGLHGSVPHETLRCVMASNQELPVLARSLISTALELGSRDNITGGGPLLRGRGRRWLTSSPTQIARRIGRAHVIERSAAADGRRAVARRSGWPDVALKILTADVDDDPDIRTRFYREARRELSHPNIITIFDVGEDGDRFHRRSCAERRSRISSKNAVSRPQAGSHDSACAGLGAAHNASIYHRDIKPGNIFVRADGILKISTSAWRAVTNMTAAGFIVGTPDYMSPEQARRRHRRQIRHLFRSVACSISADGRKPFPASDLLTLFHRSERGPPLRSVGSAARL